MRREGDCGILFGKERKITMQKEQVVKFRRCGIVVLLALLVMGGFADVAVKPPTRELTEIEKTMSRATATRPESGTRRPPTLAVSPRDANFSPGR